MHLTPHKSCRSSYDLPVIRSKEPLNNMVYLKIKVKACIKNFKIVAKIYFLGQKCPLEGYNGGKWPSIVRFQKYKYRYHQNTHSVQIWSHTIKGSSSSIFVTSFKNLTILQHIWSFLLIFKILRKTLTPSKAMPQ